MALMNLWQNLAICQKFFSLPSVIESNIDDIVDSKSQ